MYKIATKNDTWGIEGYEVPKFYHDSVKIAQDREIDEILKKGKPLPANKKHITKRGHFLDDELKQKPSKLVGPGSYKLEDEWVFLYKKLNQSLSN